MGLGTRRRAADAEGAQEEEHLQLLTLVLLVQVQLLSLKAQETGPAAAAIGSLVGLGGVQAGGGAKLWEVQRSPRGCTDTAHGGPRGLHVGRMAGLGTAPRRAVRRPSGRATRCRDRTRGRPREAAEVPRAPIEVGAAHRRGACREPGAGRRPRCPDAASVGRPQAAMLELEEEEAGEAMEGHRLQVVAGGRFWCLVGGAWRVRVAAGVRELPGPPAAGAAAAAVAAVAAVVVGVVAAAARGQLLPGDGGPAAVPWRAGAVQPRPHQQHQQHQQLRVHRGGGKEGEAGGEVAGSGRVVVRCARPVVIQAGWLPVCSRLAAVHTADGSVAAAAAAAVVVAARVQDAVRWQWGGLARRQEATRMRVGQR